MKGLARLKGVQHQEKERRQQRQRTRAGKQRAAAGGMRRSSSAAGGSEQLLMTDPAEVTKTVLQQPAGATYAGHVCRGGGGTAGWASKGILHCSTCRSALLAWPTNAPLLSLQVLLTSLRTRRGPRWRTTSAWRTKPVSDE